MSHWTNIELEIKDIKALKSACKELGLELTNENTARFYYGTRRNCDMVIKLPGKYDVAVVRDGQKFKLEADWYGGHVAKYIGEKGKLLKQTYATQLVMQSARRKGYRVSRRKLDNGKIELVLTGGR